MAHKPDARGPFDADFAKMFATLKLPLMPDMGALMAAQQRNIEALTQAYKVTLQGGQDVARRHMEIMQQTMVELGDTMQSLAGTETPQAKVTKQAEALKKAYERAVTNLKEMSETIQHANAEAVAVLNKRFAEAIEEARTLTGNPK
jgi:phasin family protein